MKSEYIGFNHAEHSAGQANLLQMELEVLNITRAFREYEKWRKGEFVLKIALKNKVDEVIELVTKLQSYFPKTDFKMSGDMKDKIIEEKTHDVKSLTLEGEIERIQRKLRMLQKG